MIRSRGQIKSLWTDFIAGVSLGNMHVKYSLKISPVKLFTKSEIILKLKNKSK